MNSLVVICVVGCLIGMCNADAPSSPFVGDWNHTYDRDSKLCMKLRAAIQLDVFYETKNGTRKATIPSTDSVIVDHTKSSCENGSAYETLALNFGVNNTLLLYFTRNNTIVKDDRDRWLLYRVEFDYTYDSVMFPDSTEPGQSDSQSNVNKTLAGIATATGRSFSCSKTGTIVITNNFNITLTSLRVQPFMSGDDFGASDHCAADQETTDLIPIIIGAALAALVIIVLIAYLIGRARANTPQYDNMK